jgi:PD-(D/E)XK nuclease superfamily
VLISTTILSDIPRVTEVLTPFTNYGAVRKEILENAAARGTSVHALCAGIAKGNWIPETMIKEEYRGYVRSFQIWQEAEVKQFDIIEKRYIDSAFRFTGQLDYVIECHDDKKYLVDIKTSASPQKTYPIQMAAYHQLLSQNGISVEGAIIVYLDKEGKPPKINFIADLADEYQVFLSALKCFEYFKRKKK